MQREYVKNVSRLKTAVALGENKYKGLLQANADLESKLDQSGREFEGKVEVLSKKLEEKCQELTQSRQSCQDLNEEVCSLKKTRDGLECEKVQAQHCVQALEKDVAALREDLDQQIAEKVEGLEKAKVGVA